MLSTLHLFQGKSMQTISIIVNNYVDAVLNFMDFLCCLKMDFIAKLNTTELNYYPAKRAKKVSVLD